MKEKIQERILELEEQRQKVVEAANAQINAITGAIQELQRLLEPEVVSDEEE